MLTFRQFITEATGRRVPPATMSRQLAERIDAFYRFHDEILDHRARLPFPSASAESDYRRKVNNIVTYATEFFTEHRDELSAEPGQGECESSHLQAARDYVDEGNRSTRHMNTKLDNEKAVAYDNALNEVHFALDAMV